MKLSDSITGVLLMMAIFLLLSIAGHSDLENELLEEQLYCERVQSGIHTDYNNLC
jgi:hypothetical protein